MNQHRQAGDPRHVAELFNRAQRHHQAGELAAAEALYRNVFTLDSRHADSIHLLGVLALQVGRNDVAAGLIAQAIGLRPNGAVYHFNFANALVGLGRSAEAEASLRTAIKLEPGLVEAHNNLANLLVGSGRLLEAAECLQFLVRRSPGYAEAHSNLASVLLLLEKNEEAVASFETALRLRPEMAELHYNLGDALNKLDRNEGSRKILPEAVRLKPDYFDAWNLLGIVCSLRQQFAYAEAAFQSARSFGRTTAAPASTAGRCFSSLTGTRKSSKSCGKPSDGSERPRGTYTPRFDPAGDGALSRSVA